jgi:class 3 adenylate cyclase
MGREVRYCTTEDGVRIAYCVEGEGPPLVVCPLLLESFSIDHLLPEYKGFLRELSRRFEVVRYDMRGTGLSQRDVHDYSRLACLGDIDAVVQALDLQSFSLFGAAGGGPRAIGYAGEHAGRVERLILAWSFARVLDLAPRPVFDRLIELMRTDWRLGARAFADLGTRNIIKFSASLEEWYLQSTTGEVAAQIVSALVDIDETGSLGRIRCPALVIHPMNDPFFTMEVGREMTALLPNARLIAMADEVHPLTDTWGPVVDAVFEFAGVGERGTGETGPRPFRTVLFTDLVGHTEMMSRLGDERGRAVLREHERITREVLKAHGGTEIKTMGDGFMASFGSVAKAVECAIALQRAFAGREGEPLNVRVGLNAGEPIEEDGDLFGATVILASRIAAKAEGGRYWWRIRCAGCVRARGSCSRTVGSSWRRGSRSRCGCMRCGGGSR